MKNIIFYVSAFALFVLQSCSVNTDVTFFKDKTSTSQVDLDAKQLMSMMTAFATDEQGGNPSFDEMNNLPSEFTSFYDLRVKDGNAPTHPDSIRIMKKIFLKKLGTPTEASGAAFKFEKFLNEDYAVAEKMMNGNTQKVPLDKLLYTNWDGKKLVISTKNLSEGFIKDMLEGDMAEAGSVDDLTAQKEQMKMMLQMMDMKVNSTLKFEGKIKSITGKHDFVTKSDDNTIKIAVDVNKILEDNPTWTNNDKEIIIITK